MLTHPLAEVESSARVSKVDSTYYRIAPPLTPHPRPPLPDPEKCLHMCSGGVSPHLENSRRVTFSFTPAELHFPLLLPLILRLKCQGRQPPVGSSSSPSASCLSPPGHIWSPSWPSQSGVDTYVARSLPRLCSVQSENSALKAEHAQIVDQLTAQHEALRTGFREQVRQLQEEHRRTVETLQQQLCRLEAQLLEPRSEPATRSTYLR